MKPSFILYCLDFLHAHQLEYECKGENVILVKKQDLQINYHEISEKILAKPDFFKKQINIWEDVFLSKPEIVKSRLNAMVGFSKKLPARVCQVKRINKLLADDFLKANHLQATVGSKLKYGLFLPSNYFRLLDFIPENETEILLAVMTFSGAKTFFEANIISYEMIRFASLKAYTIQGAFTKMLKFFINDRQPGNIMSYVDKDWSMGENYKKVGFRKVDELAPQFFELDVNNNRILQKKEGKVRNSGSIKMILDVNKK